jgi:hypothetical protein
VNSIPALLESGAQLRRPESALELFPNELKQLLYALGPKIGRSPLLFTRVCRMAAHAVRQSNNSVAFEQLYVSTLLTDYLLPVRGITLY